MDDRRRPAALECEPGSNLMNLFTHTNPSESSVPGLPWTNFLNLKFGLPAAGYGRARRSPLGTMRDSGSAGTAFTTGFSHEEGRSLFACSCSR
eukprot:s322_g19.t1